MPEPPPFFPSTASRFPLASYTIYKYKNRGFPTQFSPQHRNIVACSCPRPQEPHFLGSLGQRDDSRPHRSTPLEYIKLRLHQNPHIF